METAKETVFKALTKKAKKIIKAAQEDLGKDLSGFLKLDLLADNMPKVRLNDLKTILTLAGYDDYKSQNTTSLSAKVLTVSASEVTDRTQPVDAGTLFHNRSEGKESGRLYY